MNKNLQRSVMEVHLTTPEWQNMLRITTQKKRGKVLLTVEGRLAGESVSTLEQCWRELRAASPHEKFNIDLCGVSFIDAAGKTLLKEIHTQGGRLVTEGREHSAQKKQRSHIIFYIAFFSLLLSPALTQAQGQASALPAAGPGEV